MIWVRIFISDQMELKYKLLHIENISLYILWNESDVLLSRRLRKQYLKKPPYFYT